MDKKEMFERCAAFHGHVCGGLTIGFKAALYAMDLLGIGFSEDEDVVCISENDACGVDAIQVLLGCSVGKGNLLFHMTGKQAFSFYDRKSGRSVRLVLRPRPDTGQSGLDYYTQKEPEELFDVKETKIELPENARIFNSYKCDECGETTAENWIMLCGDKKLCPDCYKTYDRFHVYGRLLPKGRPRPSFFYPAVP